MYYIKKIFLTGSGVETSGVDLTPGLNIIYGPSETGKSYITKCIKFMYGKKDSEIDDTFGFDTIHMVLDVDGKPLTLVRRLDEEKINVSGNIDGIENGDYNLSSGKKRIGDLWLALMGIDEPTQIIKKNDFTPERLNFSSLWLTFSLAVFKALGKIVLRHWIKGASVTFLSHLAKPYCSFVIMTSSSTTSSI